jgi:hypothetical protein
MHGRTARQVGKHACMKSTEENHGGSLDVIGRAAACMQTQPCRYATIQHRSIHGDKNCLMHTDVLDPTYATLIILSTPDRNHWQDPTIN